MVCWEHGIWTAETAGCEDRARRFLSYPTSSVALLPLPTARLVAPSRGPQGGHVRPAENLLSPDGGDDGSHGGPHAESDDAVTALTLTVA